MSYTPTEWKSGDTVTSAKLNKMEQGINTAINSGNVLMVNVTYDDEDNATLDKTWKEIYDAMLIGSVIIIENDNNRMFHDNVISAYYDNYDNDDNIYYVRAIYYNIVSDTVVPGIWNFLTTSENGYPSDRVEVPEPMVE